MRLVFLTKLILWRSISLLTVFLYFSELYKIISNSNSSFEFLQERPIKPWRLFCLFIAKNGQRKKKCSLVSVLELQSQIWLRASLKLWRNLCSFKWLIFNSNLDNNLTPVGQEIANNYFCFKLKNSFNINLKCLTLLRPRLEISFPMKR